MNRLLSRYADAIFWMARYVERAENIARVLDVNETFSRDSKGGQNWHSVIALYADEERFEERYDAADARSVIQFYVLDPDNSGSILSAIRAARENARTLRPYISTEMWVHLNTFCNRLRALSPADLTEPRLARLCSMIKEGCQTHTGITEGTFYRDEGWCFYQLGRNIERADQMTRLLDVKYHLLLPSPDDVGSPLDVSQWNTLLRTAAGFHAFRREHSSGMSPQKVADFLLLNRRFPRSVQRSVQEATEQLMRLRTDFQLEAGSQAIILLDELQKRLREQEIHEVIDQGLHEYLDWVQRQLIAATEALRIEFFWPPSPQSEEASEAAPVSVAAQG